MNIIHIDFETYSECDLQKEGAFKYAAHPSTKILCVALKVNSGPIKSFHSIVDATTTIKLATKEDTVFCAHNAQFEMSIWDKVVNGLLGLWVPPVDKWRCSAAVCAYRSLPRKLEDAAKALGLEHQKDIEGYTLMMKMCKPGYDAKSGDMERLMKYCEQDVRVEAAITERLSFLPEAEQKLWELDRLINERGIHVDMDLIRSAIAIREPIKEGLAAECQRLAKCNPTQVQKLMDWFDAHGTPVPDLKRETMIKLLATLPEGDVKKVVQIRRDYATTSLAKYDAALAYEQDGVIRGQFVYHGAGTGRWTGRGVQFQNLPRGGFNEGTTPQDMGLACELIKGKDPEPIRDFFPALRPMEVMKSALRGMVIAPKGKSLFVQDFSQIEARVLAWLAGQEDVLKSFADGKDLYKFTASQIYQKPYDSITKQERFIGKVASLALGYQGGEGAFQKMALNYGVLIEEELALRIKNDWRERNGRIVKLWYDLDEAVQNCITFGKPYVVRKRITVRVEEGFLSLQLPSGRKLWYHDPKVKEVRGKRKDGSDFVRMASTYMGSDMQHNIAWGRVSLYGGKATENCLTGDTMVYTNRGRVRIADITKEDLLWDGESWVKHLGVLKRSKQPVGEVFGVGMTTDHLILGGSAWSHAESLVEEHGLLSCLHTGRLLANLQFFKEDWAHIAKLNAFAPAEGKAPYIPERYAEDMLRVAKSAVLIDRLMPRRTQETFSQLGKLRQCGAIDSQGYLADATTLDVQRTKITEPGVYWYTRSGFWIGKSSFSMRLRSKGRAIFTQTWIALTTIWGIIRGIFVSYRVKKTQGIPEELSGSNIKENECQQQSSTKDSAHPLGELLCTTNSTNEAFNPKMCWKSTGEEKEVYDIINAGPNSRFMIATPYGPIIVHNCIQAISRDLLVNAMYNTEAAGFSIIATIHDEIVSEADSDRKIEEVQSATEKLPSWAEGLPLKAAGFKTERYYKG